MKERPILFNTEMVRAILDGRKTQTRRIVKGLQPEHPLFGMRPSPYGKPGDELWVRETHQYNWLWFQERGMAIDTIEPEVLYKANDIDCDIHRRREMKWRPSLFMPRWASRIQLRITDVRVERVQEITKEDSLAEGIERTDWKFNCEPYRNYEHHKMAPGYNKSDARCSFMTLWYSINEKRGYGWDKNPWVWVVEFEVVK